MIGDEHLRALGLGLSGSHRTGKSTIAAMIAEANDCPYIASSSTQVAKDMGFKVDIGMDFTDRLAFQEEVLRRFTLQYEEQNGLFVTDRTPLDMAAYLMTDWKPEKSTPELDERANRYVKQCIETTSRFFFLVTVVQPGIPYVCGDGKPAPNPMYQEAMNTTIIGLAADHRVKSHFYLLPSKILNREDRVALISKVYADRINDYASRLHSLLTTQ